ncbi:MAG: glycosyltransferase family 39 protein [Chloroflexi bacterium]|nr:glycosyltransferase family 39 protein [Chloroflexota bacterium]
MTLILLLTLAVFLRLYRLSDVPPGIHDDEVINAQIADQLRAGAPFFIFYEAGEGREGLYHPLLVASRMLTARVPDWYRLPSVVCSVLTILLVHRLSRRWFGPWAALVTAGGLAVTFWPVHLGREALRVVTLPPLAAGMALALWRGLEQPARGKRAVCWFVLAGLLLGLAQYTYLAARALPLFIVLFVVYLARFHRARLRLHWRGLVLLLIIGVLIAAPLAIYIGVHWEQQERVTRLSEPLYALLTGDSRPVLSSAAATLGMFTWRGDPQPHYNLPGRPVFEPVGGMLFLGGVLVTLLNPRQPASAFCLLWTMATLGPGMLTQPAPHFVRTAGVLVTAFVFPGLAVRWLERRLGPKGRLGLGVVLGLLLVVNAGLTFRDYFRRWPELDDVRGFRHVGLAEVACYLDRADDVTPVAVCTPFLNERHFFWRTDRQALPYLMNRRDLDVGWYNCLEAQLLLRGGQTGRYLFGAGWDFAPFVPLEWIEQAQTVTSFRDGRMMCLEVADQLKAWLAQFTRPDGSSLVFGEVMTFLGYQMEAATPVPGSTLEVLTAWEVLATPPNDLAIFVHLLDDDGNLVAQGDALAALSDTFRPEDVFVQYHVIALTQDVPPGEYRLATGLYVRGGERLLLGSGTCDTLILGTVEVSDVSD